MLIRLAVVIASLIGAATAASAHAAGTGMDCPAAFEPFSSRTMLVDLLAVPATKAVVAKDAPDFLPLTAFAGLISPDMIPNADRTRLAKLDADLGAIKVTPAAAKLRCARYDKAAPRLDPANGLPAVLIFSKTTGFRDDPSISASIAMLRAIGDQMGWQMVFTENGAAFARATLRRFKAIVWSNVSGDVLTVPQRAALRDYVEGGGSFIAFHGSGGDPKVLWDWYRDDLIGARFIGHPIKQQFQSGRIVVEPDAGIIATGLGTEWTMTDEWYSFAQSPRLAGAHILLRLDEASYSTNDGDMMFGKLQMGADHPIAWTRCVGRGRSFYSAIGHLPATYSEPHNVRLLTQAIAWGIAKGACR